MSLSDFRLFFSLQVLTSVLGEKFECGDVWRGDAGVKNTTRLSVFGINTGFFVSL